MDEFGIYYQPELAGEQVRRVRRLALIRLGWAVLTIAAVLIAWRIWPAATDGWVLVVRRPDRRLGAGAAGDRRVPLAVRAG